MLDTQIVQAEMHGAVKQTLTKNISLINNTRLFDVAPDPAAHLGRVNEQINEQIGMLTYAEV